MKSAIDTPDIYDFRTAADWLKADFDLRQTRNSGFSLRSYAKSFELSHSILTRLFGKQSTLSKENIRQISVKKQLSAREHEYFEEIAAQRPDQTKLDSLSMNARKKTVVAEEISPVLNMAAFTILQMIEAKQSLNPKFVAKELGFTEYEILEVVRTLERLGFVEALRGGALKTTNKRLVIESAEAKEALTRFYAESFEHAKKSVAEQSAQERAIGTETMTLSEADLPEARKILDEALDRIAALASRSKDPKHVYHCNTVLFRVAKIEE